MGIEVYLNFNGNCREAVEFYADAFQTDMQQIMTFKDAPPDPDFPIPEEAKNRIMHTYLNICGNRVMFSDTLPGAPVTIGNNITITVMSNNIDNLKSYFEKLKQGGKVSMEIQETFWSKCYGSLTDKFGVEWQLSHADKA